VADIKIDWDRVAIRKMFRSPTGEVGRNLAERGKRIEEAAKKLAPGTMGSYVHLTVAGSVLTGTTVTVYCDHPAIIFVSKGTRPHVIMPSNKKALRFVMGGGTVFAMRVNHPGTHPNFFMAKAMTIGGM
jgi:hypothetical protein